MQWSSAVAEGESMSYPITTLKALREHRACFSGYNRLVRALQGRPFTKDDEAMRSYLYFDHDEPIPLTLILERNGISEAIWSLRASNARARDVYCLGLSFGRRTEYFDKTGTQAGLEARAAWWEAYKAAEMYKAADLKVARAKRAARVARDAAYAAWAVNDLSARQAAETANEAAWHAARAKAARDAAWANAVWKEARAVVAWDEESAIDRWKAGTTAYTTANAAADSARETTEKYQALTFIQMCRGQAGWQEGQP